MNFLVPAVPGFYAGIGSRNTPQDILSLMARVSSLLGGLGWTLRSGGAEGADSAFEAGADSGRWPKEIFLPWDGFNGRHGEHVRPSTQAMDLGRRYHPNWGWLSPSARLLHARNAHQILGPGTCDSPSSFLLCWTPDGATYSTSYATGGTGQAIRIAVAWDIPVHNLAVGLCRNEWEQLVSGVKCS